MVGPKGQGNLFGQGMWLKVLEAGKERRIRLALLLPLPLPATTPLNSRPVIVRTSSDGDDPITKKDLPRGDAKPRGDCSELRDLECPPLQAETSAPLSLTFSRTAPRESHDSEYSSQPPKSAKTHESEMPQHICESEERTSVNSSCFGARIRTSG